MSLIRILLDHISKAINRRTDNDGESSNHCPASCPESTGSSSTVCHNPEHISDWHAHEIHEYQKLCIGKECCWIVPFGGNAYLSNKSTQDESTTIPVNSSKFITPAGLVNWNSKEIKVSLYFHCVQEGDYLVALRLRVPEKHSSGIRVSIMSCTNRASGQQCQIPVIKEINIQGTRESSKLFQIVECAKFHVSAQGYVKLELCGVKRSGSVFADVSHAILIPDNGDSNSRQKRSLDSASTDAPTDKTSLKFVSDPGDFYFGRRGPSVHLNYVVPNYQDEAGGRPRNIKYFYNEVIVPSKQDVIGSYFCACGFSGGYFGIQVNSSTERRILFSIWSAYNCENPNEIPHDFKVNLIRKGDQVYVGEFGNEGSGAQSYLRYPWKSEKVYKFLVQARPLGPDQTIYSAWFAEEQSDWKLIASFRKPKVSTWLHGLYSFSENFIPEMGHVERRCLFGNQWVWDVEHQEWIEITSARFTADGSVSKGTRTDVAGGVVDGNDCGSTGASHFYLRNCGFFSDTVTPGISLCRNGTRSRPCVDFSKLN